MRGTVRDIHKLSQSLLKVSFNAKRALSPIDLESSTLLSED